MEPINSAPALRSWLDSCVLGDLRTLVRGIDAYYASDRHVDAEGRPVGAGNFLLVAGCFAAIEYFGHLVNDGTNKEARSLAFIRRFLVPINPKYAEVDVLLWRCFRNGTIHRSWLKRIRIEGEDYSIATGAAAEEGDPHLAPDPDRSDDTFLINGRQLLKDLGRALDGPFGDWLGAEANDSLLNRANPEDLRIGRGNTALQAQAAKAREWSRVV